MKTKNELENIALQEAGFSRIWKQTLEYDIALISASRKQCINCVYPQKDKEEGGIYTPAENRLRTKLLRTKLLTYKFGVTAVDGGYIENNGTPFAEYKGEDSFFVVNLKNEPKFKDKLIELGKEFCQDSVGIKEKDDDFYLYGTNKDKDIGLGKRRKTGEKFLGGVEQEYMSKIRNRPFAFVMNKKTNEVKVPDLEYIVENINRQSDGRLHFFNISGIQFITTVAKDEICHK